ncbi:MAG: cbb3-type cytochrome c oxidase subunit II [Chthoniobacterales bacterium]
MKGLQPLFLGIFGVFAFSWLGMTVVPNLQIGSLNPQTDEDGTDIYPMPQSGMVARGVRVYAANGCFYCHSQQVRPDYGGADLERKWGLRRSAPRDYIFEPVVLLGKMRSGPDLANVGHRPGFEEEGAATPLAAGGLTSPAPASSPAVATHASSPATAKATASPAVAASAATAPSTSAATAAAAPATSPAAGAQPTASVPGSAPAMVTVVSAFNANGNLRPYTAAWHHRHLYNPRSISDDSNMPAYRFLYDKRRISGVISPDAINFAGDTDEQPEAGWEVVPSYDAKCLVAYLMSRDQSHPLKEAKSPVTVAAAPAKEAQK